MESPFIILENLLSPLECENIISDLDNNFPDVDENNQPIKSTRFSKLHETRIIPRLREVASMVEDKYGVEYEGITALEFEWYPQNSAQEKHICSNSQYMGGDWVRINDYDFTGIIFLNDYQENYNLDPYYEVKGGQLEFPNFKFSVNPKRGTLILFPGAPNFVHRTLFPEVGDANQIRFHIGTRQKYEYNVREFSGTYKDWFKNY